MILLLGLLSPLESTAIYYKKKARNYMPRLGSKGSIEILPFEIIAKPEMHYMDLR